MAVEQATLDGATEIDDFGDLDPVSTDSPDGGDGTQNTSGDGDFEPTPDDAPAEQPAEPAEAPAPAKTEPEAPAAPEFDADLLASVGMTADEAAAEFGSNAELARYDALLNRQLLQQARARAAAQQAQEQADTGEPAEGQQPAALKPVQQPQPAGEELPSPFAIDRERWDKDTLEHLVDPIQKWAIERDRENQDLRQTVQALKAHYENQQRERYVADFESAIDALGDDWTPVLGKGTLHEITPETLKARQELDAAAQMLNQVRTTNGLPALPLKRAVQAAAAQAFPDRYKEITRRTVSGQVLKRQGQYTARPSAKTTSGQTATERAIQAAEQIYEDRGGSTAPQSLGPDDF